MDHTDGDFFWADISAFEVFSDPDFCYEVMPKIFKYVLMNILHYTANKIPLTIAGFFIVHNCPPKEHISNTGIALIGALPINLGLWAMPLMSRGNGMHWLLANSVVFKGILQ